MKILIVDDSKFNLAHAKNILDENQTNCDVVLCESGKAVLEVLEHTEADIILLDIVMPEMSGIEVLKILRGNRKHKDLQIIMLTSIQDKNVLKECFELGANDYINKPIEQIEFISRIKASMNVRAYQKNLNYTLDILEKQNRKLKEAHFHLLQKEKMAAIGELAAGIAHEINNPIAYISSNFESLNKYINRIKAVYTACDIVVKLAESGRADAGELTGKLREVSELKERLSIDYIIEDLESLIHDSMEGTGKVAKIVQSLRSFTKSSDVDENSYWDFNIVIEEVLLMIQNEVEKTARIEKSFSDLPLVLCNKIEMAQVLINILSNAIQAIKSQQRKDIGKIMIKTYSSGCNIICEISDDGPGIEPDIMGKIFDPFFTTKDVGAGIGLGLSISYDIVVSKHKGELSAKSELQKGATFILKIPGDCSEGLLQSQP